jgi:hypothetical protein
MRPEFTVELSHRAEEVMQRIRSKLGTVEPGCRAISAGRCADFFVDEQQRRFWSPHLSVRVDDSDSGSVLRGRFAPRPEVWTLIVFLYFLMVFAVALGAAFGYVQWVVGDTPWGLLTVPIGTVTIAALHAASLVGQRLSADQMQQLREVLNLLLECALGPSDSDRHDNDN